MVSMLLFFMLLKFLFGPVSIIIIIVFNFNRLLDSVLFSSFLKISHILFVACFFFSPFGYLFVFISVYWIDLLCFPFLVG